MASKALRINPETPSKKPVVRTQSLHTIGGSHNCGHKLIVGECLNSVSANARSTLPRRRLGPFFVNCDKSVRNRKMLTPIKPAITGTTSANWNEAKRVLL